MQPLPSDVSDPVACLIASKLQIMESNGLGKLVIQRKDDEAHVGFGPVAVTAEDFDIALVRLGSRLMDEPSLSKAFFSAIGAELKRFEASSR